MTVLLDYTAPRTIDTLIDRIAALKPDGLVEAWVFDDRRTRRQAEAKLAELGISARFHASYKPLLHHFIEDAQLEGVSRIVVRYPVVPTAVEKRFWLETYPLSAMLEGVSVEYIAEPSNSTTYTVELEGTNGVSSYEVFAPNRIHMDHVGVETLSPTGWLRIAVGRDRRAGRDRFRRCLCAGDRSHRRARFRRHRSPVRRAEHSGAAADRG